MGCQPGSSRAANSTVSGTSRRDARGGKRYSFWAMYSLRMSFCVVPFSLAREMPRFSAAAMSIAQITGAGPLIVMEVETSSRGMSANSRSMSCRDEIATPHLPTSPWASSWSAS